MMVKEDAEFATPNIEFAVLEIRSPHSSPQFYPSDQHLAPSSPERDRTGNGKDCAQARPLQNGIHDCCCNETWVDFTGDTSLHGLKYIWMKDAFVIRRLLWLVLTLSCSAIMMYQILDRIIYFHSKPVTVDVRINFNTSLYFPSVTICNQNAFRASKTAELGHYGLLTDLYDSPSHNKMAQLQQHGAFNISQDALLNTTRHRLEDMLISCQWKGQRCGLSNFEQVSTDHGICYMLDSRNLTVESAGADDGLSLTLNVEQYEYMPGPHSAAGMKILLHDRHEFPKVHALGQALSAGVHSFLAIKLVSVENLPYPHGQCASPPLTHYSHYGTANCESDCTTRLLYRLCVCRLFYMPGSAPVCTLRQYYECYVPNKSTLRQMMMTDCDCPVPCSFFVFDPIVSYADASPLVVERFLVDANKTALAHSYNHAREVTDRLQPEKRQAIERLVQDLNSRQHTLKHVCMTEIGEMLRTQSEGLAQMEGQTNDEYNRTVYLYQYQQFIVEKNFIRAAVAMKERTFSVVPSAMQELVHKVDSKILKLTDPNLTESEVRQTLFLLTLNELDGRIDITRRALENYTELYNSIVTGTPIFNYKFKREPRRNSVHIVPKPLFHYVLKRTRFIRFRSKKVGEDLSNIISRLTFYKELAEEAYYTRTVNATSLLNANVFFLRACREFLQSIDMFLNDGLGYSVVFMKQRLDAFSDMWRSFSTNRDALNSQLNSMRSLAQGLEEGFLAKVDEAVNMTKAYLKDGSVKKKDIAQFLVSPPVQVGQSSLKNFFAELRARGQEVHDLWGMLQRDSEKIFNTSLQDPNLQDYYNFSDPWAVGRLWEILSFIQGNYSQYRDADIRNSIKNYDDEFLTSLSHTVSYMQNFLDTGHIDTTFIRNNFLRLNIFYRELNYEQITQQEAYDIFALLCDIGGSMGLFLGASVMTIFELLDLFVFQYRLKT